MTYFHCISLNFPCNKRSFDFMHATETAHFASHEVNKGYKYSFTNKLGHSCNRASAVCKIIPAYITRGRYVIRIGNMCADLLHWLIYMELL